MSDFANDELLSAYLDDELSPEERARVERLLAEQPESRQLLDELRAIKTSLERVPRVRLGHDFAEQVLRQAEKEVLTRGSESVESAQRAEAIERAGGFTWQRMRRPTIWASLALAAGLLIMFLDHDRARPRQVAKAPAAGAGEGAGGGEIGAPAAAPHAPEPQSDFGEFEDRKDAAMDGYTKSAQATPSEPPVDERAPAGASSPPPPPAMKPGRGERSAGLAGGMSAPRRDEAAKDMPADTETDGVAGVNGTARLDAITADDTLVVWCYMTPGADADSSFREVLAQQNIEWADETPVDELDARGRTFAYREHQLSDRAKRPALGTENEELSLMRKRREGARQQSNEGLEQAVRDTNAEIVLVEASEPQIEAVLEALDRDSEHVAAVQVEPAANVPQQQQYARYGRGLSELKAAQQRKSRPTTEYFSKKESRAEPDQSPASKSSPAEAKQSQAQGIARRLLMRGTTPSEVARFSDEGDKKPAATASGKPPQKAEKVDKGVAKSDDAKKELSELQSNVQDLAEANRVQVLFVISPAEEQAPAAAAPKK